MKKFFLSAILIAGFYIAKAQTSPYISIPDTVHPGKTILVGNITKYALINNEEYNVWYQPNIVNYKPEQKMIDAFASAADKGIKFLVFAGTWCDDSHFIVPKFFKLTELSFVPEKNISFTALDRHKHAFGNLAEVMAVTNVPTIILTKNGKEIGRVVEYGKTGRWDNEIAEMINAN